MEDDAERRYNIIAEARETLARIAHVTVEQRDHSGDYWSGPEPKPAAEMVGNAHHLTDAETARWERTIDGKISAAINRQTEIWREVMAQALASERKLHRAEVEKLDLRISGLLSEVTKRQAVEAAERRENDGVVEVPQFIQRRRHDAA